MALNTMESNHHEQHQPNASLLSGKSPIQSTSTTTPTTSTTSTSTITTTTYEPQPYSSDPFALNYRHICHWDEEKKADYIATWPLPLSLDFCKLYESAEYAELTRPWDQLRVLLRQRGLEDEFFRIIYNTSSRGDEVEREGGEDANAVATLR